MRDSLDPNFLAALLLLSMFAMMFVGYHLRFLGRRKPDYARIQQQNVSNPVGRQLMLISYFWTSVVGRPLAARGVSPDTVSAVSLILGAAAGVAFAFAQFGWGAWLFFWSGFLDVVDGIVARSRTNTSVAGAVIDSALDRYVDFVVLAGIAVHYRGQLLLLCLTLAAILGTFMISYSSAKAEALGATPPRGGMKRTERGPLLVLGAAFSALTVGSIEPALGLPENFGLPIAIAVGLTAVFANLSAARRLRYLIRSV